jgi:hypothetical protein
MARDGVKKLGANSLKTAKNLTDLSSNPTRLKGSVSALDKNDLYHLNFSSRSNLDLQLSTTAKKATVGFQIFTLDGVKSKIFRAIGRSNFSDLKAKEIKKYFNPVAVAPSQTGQTKAIDNLALDPGEYYVRVYQRKGNSNYTLSLSAAPVPTPVPTPSKTPSPAPIASPSPSPAAFTLSQRWLQQLQAPYGTSGNDYTYGTTTDGNGNLYVAGVANATVGQAGDGFVAAYDPNGALLWKRSIDTPGLDVASDVAVDSAGNYFVTGASVTGSGSTINSDVFVTKYNKDGVQQWIKTTNTKTSGGSNALETGSGIKLDGNSVYVTGLLNAYPLPSQGQGFISKYDLDGNAVTEFGGSGTVLLGAGGTTGLTAGVGLAVSNGTVYVTGITGAAFGLSSSTIKFTGGDAFVAGFNGSTGASLWNQTLASSGTGQDYARGIAISGTDLYITGQTAGLLPSGSLPANTYAGKDDGFLAKYNSADGTFQWSKQFGTSGLDQSQAIATDSTGKIYLTGETDKSLFGNPIGKSDAWIAVYDSTGNLVGNTQIGTSAEDETYGITVDSTGNVYVAGQTYGAFSGATNAGKYDAWVAKYALLPN